MKTDPIAVEVQRQKIVKRINGTPAAYTKTELRKFRALVEGTESRNQLTRISSRLEMKEFVEKTGKNKCDAMFEVLKREVA
jgi:hypothetical protein